MKKIVLHIPAKMNRALKTAGKEAIEEFVSMFPEYKDSFRIEIRDDANIRGKEISQAEYDAMPDNETKRQCLASPRGTWLLPHKSMEWYILSSQVSGSDKIDVKKMTTQQSAYVVNDENIEIPICLVNNNLSPSCYGYTGGVIKTKNGVETEAVSVVVSAKACQNNEDLIKTIIIHELGHVFNATHAGRANVVESNGPHCKNHLCIMGASDYPELNRERLRRKQNGNPPFCDECIASMRECMSRMPELTRRVQAQQMPQQPIQTPQPQQTPSVVSKPYSMPVAQRKNPSAMPPLEQWHECLKPEPHNNREWKKDIREFYQNVAARDGDTYKENIKSQNYVARIKRADGSTLEIEANNEYNIALGRTKTPDGDNTPTIQDMRDLVKLAQQKRSGMNFSPDNTPEFNARLLIACLEAHPKIAMKNQPHITSEFLTKLKPETKHHLQTIVNNTQAQLMRQGGRS